MKLENMKIPIATSYKNVLKILNNGETTLTGNLAIGTTPFSVNTKSTIIGISTGYSQPLVRMPITYTVMQAKLVTHSSLICCSSRQLSSGDR